MSDYSIEAYNPEWAAKFQDTQRVLTSIFGSKALVIEHVGSTSVPGMKAKPIIDVLITVKSLTALEREKVALLEKGYQFQENYIAPNTYLFRRVDTFGNKLENIHVCERGAPMEKQFLVMRDYLRAFPEEARVYAELKESLFRQFPNDYEAYRAAKDPFLKNLEQKAYQWRSKV